MSNSTVSQLKKRIQQLNRLIAKFPYSRSLVRKWAFELVVCEGKLETLTETKVEKPVQLTIWDVKKSMLEIVHSKTFQLKDWIKSQGCKWNPSKKAWVAPDQEIYEEIMARLEQEESLDKNVTNRFYGNCGFDGIGIKEIDNFLATKDQPGNAPQPKKSISYIPTKEDALKLFGEEQFNRYWDERIPVEASKILASGEVDEIEIFDRLNYDGMKGRSVDLLIDLVNHFRQNPPNKAEEKGDSEPVYIELQTYRNKGLNAYLAPVINGKPDYNQNLYGEPIDDDAKNKAYRGKKHIIRVRIDNLPDGEYAWKEAGGADGNKARYGWIKIQSGEIIEEGTR